MSRKRWSIAFEPEGEAGVYQVTVRRSGSVHRFKTNLPPDIADLWSAPAEGATVRSFRSADTAELTPENRFFQAADLPTLKDIGERVFDAIFDVGRPGEGPKIVGALEDRIADNEGVELEIDLSQTAELSGIPWESLYLRSRDRFLAIGTTSNIVRKLDTQSDLPPPVERPLRILVVAANPWRDLQTDVELGNIAKRIDNLVTSGQSGYEVEALPAARRDELRRKINDWQPHVIHYIGHSDFEHGEGYLALETEEAELGDKLTAETLRNMLLNNRPWLVVLNSCRSGQTSAASPMAGVAQNLLQRINVPFVIGMQQPVSDQAAIAFSQDFYAALLGGETIADAVTMGRAAIASGDDQRTQVELITPALYTSGETDSIAFVAPAAAAAAPIAAVAAAPVAAAAAPSDNAAASGSWLERVDRKTKVVASIVGSALAILAGVAGIPQLIGWDSGGDSKPEAPVPPSPRLEPAPTTQAVPSDDGGAAPSPRLVRRVAQSGPRIEPTPIPRSIPRAGRPRTVPLRRQADLAPTPDDPTAPPPEPQMAERSIPVVGTGMPAYPRPDTPYVAYALGAAALPAPPFRFENVAAQPPLTGIGTRTRPGSDGLAMSRPELWDYGYRAQDIEATGVVGPLDQARVPAFCDGLALRVGFSLGSSEVVSAERARLAELGDELACPDSGLVVAGLTDTTGSDDLNAELSLARAQAVADILLDRPGGRQVLRADLQGYGERYLMVDTGDGVAEARNRRAEVYLSGRCSNDRAGTVAAFAPGEWEAGLESLDLPRVSEWDGERVLIGYMARDAAALDDASTDEELMRIAALVSRETGLPPAAVYPMKLGPACLDPGEVARIEVTFQGGSFVN